MASTATHRRPRLRLGLHIHSKKSLSSTWKLPSFLLQSTTEVSAAPQWQQSTSEIVKPAVCARDCPDCFAPINDRDPDRPNVQKGGIVEVGSAVPDFSLTGVDGSAHRLSEFRGRKVMLCFYRYSTCPACAYTISKLIGNYKKLAWASKLTVITVFRTDIESLREGLTDADAPIRRLAGISASGYPFLGLADPDGTAASSFNVARREFARLGTLLFAGLHPRAFREVYRGGARGADALLPSEFLIDEGGVLVDVLRARKKDESIALSRVDGFLLGGYKGHPLAAASAKF